MSTLEQARKSILDAIEGYGEEGQLISMPSSVWLGESEQLSRDQVMVGVDALRIMLDLTSANSGGRNLYELLDLYLRDRKAADAINEVIASHGRQIHQWRPAPKQTTRASAPAPQA